MWVFSFLEQFLMNFFYYIYLALVNRFFKFDLVFVVLIFYLFYFVEFKCVRMLAYAYGRALMAEIL